MLTRIYVGTDALAKTHGLQFYNTIRDSELDAIQSFKGYSRMDVHGGWLDANGKAVTETSHVWEIITDGLPESRRALRIFAERLRRRFLQEAVLVVHIAAVHEEVR